MRILVTGAKGFVGKNLITALKNQGFTDIDEFDMDNDATDLDRFCSKAEFVFHLAGVNRPENTAKFMEGNADFTEFLINKLLKYNNTCPVMYSSSAQAVLDNPYGNSKRAGETALLNYSKRTGVKVLIYRFPNVFGKWCRPNYNSVVATFCYNICHYLPIEITNPDMVLTMVYIDDLTEELIRALLEKENRTYEYCEVPISYQISVDRLAMLIRSFRLSRTELTLPDMSKDLVKKLYSTYLTYIPEQELCYELKMNQDQRGFFTEFIKQPELGQLSVNVIKPGIIKGNHWHNAKNEKFLVVCGHGMVRLRKITSSEVIEYDVSDKKLVVVDIPPGYTHNIENRGDTDMITLIWANESYDKSKPDTYYMEV